MYAALHTQSHHHRGRAQMWMPPRELLLGDGGDPNSNPISSPNGIQMWDPNVGIQILTQSRPPRDPTLRETVEVAGLPWMWILSGGGEGALCGLTSVQWEQ